MKAKHVLLGIVGIVLLILLAVGMEFAGLSWKRYFNPKHQNVEREVFENTKSYTHGKIQDLAKYYEEYNKKESMEEKEAIASLIKMNFAEFDASSIQSDKLKNFLINIRGY